MSPLGSVGNSHNLGFFFRLLYVHIPMPESVLVRLVGFILVVSDWGVHVVREVSYINLLNDEY